MSEDEPKTPSDPAAILRAALEAKRKTAARSGPPGGAGRRTERDAAARSAAKSKPAIRR
ncbi:MAG TPA: hypothetical protein VG960_10320 [Caulobacteraceae bacterium]|nr:hypothetical protein [Caulobacteraceae bacterium]